MKHTLLCIGLALACVTSPRAAYSISIADAKASSEGSTVTVSGALTAVFTDWVYIESSDRNCGIRVYKTSHGLSAPGQVTVTNGTVLTSTDGERYISGTPVRTDGPALGPLGILCRDVGGFDFRYNSTPPKTGQQGTADAYGLNSVGLLVRVVGTLQCTGTARATLNDSGNQITVIAPTGTFPTLQAPYPPTVVTGISSCELDTGTGLLKPVIRLANSLSPNQHSVQWLSWPNRATPAQIEQDVSLPSGTGTATVSAGGGGHIRVLLYGESTITDVLINGLSLNSSFAAVTPSGKSYQLYSPRFLPGGVPTALMNAGEPVWYRIRPVTSGSTTNTEIIVRLRTQPTSAVSVVAQRANGTQISLSVSSPSSVKPRFGFVTTNTARNVIHANVLLPQSLPGENVDKVRLDGTDVTALMSAPNGYGNSGVLPVDIAMAAPLTKGSFHLLECLLTSGEHVWATFRAGSGFATAMFGKINDAQSYFNDLHNHYIDAAKTYSHDTSEYNLATSYGIRFMQSHQDFTLTNSFNEATWNNNHGYDMYAYWMYDEPDLADSHAGYAEGTWAQYLVKLGEGIAQANPINPTFLNDNGGGYYTYGLVCDITSSDYYYPNHADRDGWDPLPLFFNRAKSHRAGAMPCPALRFLNASPDPDDPITRAPFPGEERITYYASIGGGDNGLFYYWYNSSPSYGCQFQTALWAEIAKINKETKLLQDYIGCSFPAVFSMTLPSNTWMRVLEVGKDVLLCPVINTNYVSSLTAFTYTPAASVPIQVTLPAGRTPISAVTVDDTGPHALSFTVSGGRISFNAGTLQVGKFVLISFKTGLLEELNARWAAL
jgi:hypothetical protein